MAKVVLLSALFAASTLGTGLGSYIAHGIRIEKYKAGNNTTSSQASNASNEKTSYSTKYYANSSSTSSSGRNSTIPATNQSVSSDDVDTCWDEWSIFWNHNSNDAAQACNLGVADLEQCAQVITSSFSFVAKTTVATTLLETAISIAPISGASTTETYTTTYTSTIEFDGFASTTLTTTETFTGAAEQLSTSTTTYTIHTLEPLGVSVIASPRVTPPPCVLPTSVPQCEAEWTSYGAALSEYWNDRWHSAFNSASGGTVTEPRCTQASISSSACDLFRSAYYAEWIAEQADIALNTINMLQIGYVYNQTTITGSNGTSSYTSYIQEPDHWPTSSVLAPGCTVGCARCAVTGGSVRLIYWPTTLTSSALDRTNASATTSDAALVVAETLGTTFTSPTLYISFASVFASDSCSGIGPTLYNTIIPVQSTDLSSLWASALYIDMLQTASFNLADLNTPVPDQIYNSQLRCAASTQYWMQVYFNDVDIVFANGSTETVPSTYPACPRTLPYEPMLIIPTSLLDQLDPEWSTCSADIRGLYDPPLPLTAVSAPATPTLPHPEATTKPAPAQLPSPNRASPTLDPDPNETLKTTNTAGLEGSVSSIIGSVSSEHGNHDASLTSKPDPNPQNPGTRIPSVTLQDFSKTANHEIRPTTGALSQSDDPGTGAGSIIGSILGDPTADKSTLAAGSTIRSADPEASIGGEIGSILGASNAQSTASTEYNGAGEQAETSSADYLHTESAAGGGITYTSGGRTTVHGTTAAATLSGLLKAPSTSAVAAGTLSGFSKAPSTSAVAAGMVSDDTVQRTEVEAHFTISGTAYAAFQLPGQTGTAILVDDADDNTQTLSVGGQAVRIASTAVSLATAGVVIASSTIPFSTITGSAENVAVLSIDSNVYTVVASPSESIATMLGPDGSTTILTVSGPAMTIGSQTVSLASPGVVVDGTSFLTWTTATMAGAVPVPSGAGSWNATPSSADGVAAATGDAPGSPRSIGSCGAVFMIGVFVMLIVML